MLRKLLRNSVAMIGLFIVCTVIVAGIFAPYVAPHDPLEQNLMRRLKPPAWNVEGDRTHLLGTDQVGRDILSRLIYGSRISLQVGFGAVVISGALGVTLGLVSGYYGRGVDEVIMRLADVQLAFPPLLLAIAVMGVLGAGLLNIILVLAVVNWVLYARMVRGDVLSLRSRPFVEAARATGARDRTILFRHLLPNVMGPVIVIATFSVAQSIISEASLSFLGIGVPPPTPTWGAMLSQSREYIATAWWLVTFPGLAIMVTVLGINLVGDWLRDLLDPKVRI